MRVLENRIASDGSGCHSFPVYRERIVDEKLDPDGGET
jgi:hypothetical protein